VNCVQVARKDDWRVMIESSPSLLMTAVGPLEPQVANALLAALEYSSAVFCLADERDDIRYVSSSYRATFIPHYDGNRINFMSAIETAIRAGTSIRLVSTSTGDFVRTIGERRKRQTGSFSFSTDMVDGSWWWVTDTKLPNGWMLCVAQNISSLKRVEFELREAHADALEEARTDYLTGVSNRRHGLRQAEALFRLARSNARPFSIALLDLDHFKSINDIYGHEIGDRALVHFARHIVAAIGAEARFSRLGGDEFLLVQPDTRSIELGIILGNALSGMPLLDVDGEREGLRLSLSVGLADVSADDTWPGLMHKADMALYDAKAGGRNRISSAA
jgi:diguanylate cyclase (GGDEF)-like protein